jgi:sugar phosphate isomerase/epimerase
MATDIRLCLSEPRATAPSLRDDVRAASEAGFSSLDLWAPKLDDCLATYPLIWLDMHMQEHGVYPLSISGLEPLLWNTREDRLVYQARFLELCTHLDALGGGILVVHLGASSTDDGEPATIRQPPMVRALRDCSDLAAPFEVRVALEFQAGAGSALWTLSASQEVVHSVERNNVGLALGIDQLRESGGKPEDVEALDVKRLWLVRLAAPSPVPPFQWRTEEGRPSDSAGGRLLAAFQEALCQRLAARGFRGPYCVRPPEPASSGQRSADALIEGARQARQAALDLLTPLYP